MTHSNNLTGIEWDWNKINSGADNVGSILNTGFDIFGTIRDTFGDNSSGQNTNNSAEIQQQLQLYQNQLANALNSQQQQQAGLGIDNQTLMVIGGLVVGGIVLSNLMKQGNRTPVEK